MITELMNTSAYTPPRSTRTDETVFLSSMEMGKINPVMYFPGLREDQVNQGRARIAVNTTELTEMPLNGIAVTAHVWLVPHLALEQFNGSIDRLNKAYTGTQDVDGVVPTYFEKNKYWNGSARVTDATPDDFDTAGDTAAFYKLMGIHTVGDVNNTLVQCYNVTTNQRYQYLSKSLPMRDEFDHSLAQATWPLNHLKYIVPDFDERYNNGEATISGLTFKAPVNARFAVDINQSFKDAESNAALGASGGFVPGTLGAEITDAGDYYVFEEIFAELTQGGTATLSLADLENARKTAAFAKIRAKYSERVTDDDIIDLFMSGIQVPAAAMQEAMLLQKVTVPMVYDQQYATDAANLDDSVTRGYATVDLSFKTPRMNTGFTVLVTLEVVPEQLYERKQDCWMSTTTVDELPDFLVDYLDPQKIETVQNRYVDVNHTDGDGIFGYAPLNYKWMDRKSTNVGGKYFRPASDAYDENRARIITAETSSEMTLNQDFYLVSGMHKKMFADQITEGLEVSGRAALKITGNTVFGPALMEATNDYDVIDAEVDHTRIVPAE
jgi:hypothetical protein